MDRYEALRDTAGAAGAEAPLNAPVFACHKSSAGNPMACAGWLATCGYDHLGVRLAVATGGLPAEALTPQSHWPALYPSYDDMVAAQGADGAARCTAGTRPAPGED